ncbi:MAG: S49 family peptidase [Kiritimatiellia bacterium]
MSTSETSAFPPLSPQPPPIPRRRRRKSHWLLWTILGVSLLVNLVTCTDVGNRMAGYGYREYPMVDQTLAWGSGSADTHVAILSLEGVIFREAPATFFGSALDPVSKLLQEIQAATVDSRIRAILLQVNSPGGGVTASDEIYRALMAFKASDPDRKIVIHIGDMAASGGYYAALAGDLLIAQPTSVVGSIGVMISALNMHELSEKIGVEDVSLTSSDNKALLNSFAPVDPEHSLILQNVVDQMYVRFRDLVLEHRPFTPEFAQEHSLLDGRVFTLPAARDFGLVDEIGYDDHARARVLSLLGMEEAGFYEVTVQESWAGLFAMRAPELLYPLNTRSRFLYLWKP